MMDINYFNNSIQTSEPTPLIRHGWLRAVLFLISALIITAIFSSVAIALIAFTFGLDLLSPGINARDLIKNLGLPANIIISFFGFAGMFITVWLFRRFVDRKTFRSLGFKFEGFQNDFTRGLIFGAVLITTGFSLLTFSDIISIKDFHLDVPLLFGYLLFFAIGSLNEEIMIRGYILNNLIDSMNQYLALFISSLLFAVLHLANANVTLLSFVNILLAGLLLGIYYIHTRNLWLPIALHFSWNFFQGPVFGFEVSGVDIKGFIIQELSGGDLWTGGDFGFEGSLIATLLMLGAITLLHIKYKRPDCKKSEEKSHQLCVRYLCYCCQKLCYFRLVDRLRRLAKF